MCSPRCGSERGEHMSDACATSLDAAMATGAQGQSNVGGSDVLGLPASTGMQQAAEYTRVRVVGARVRLVV
jgi:hypothetical protein